MTHRFHRSLQNPFAHGAIVLLVGAALAMILNLPGSGAAEDLGPTETEIAAHLADLRALETELRATTNFAELAPSSRSLGTNPYRVVKVPDQPYLVGLLRGSDHLVALGKDLDELARVDTPESPTGIAVDGARIAVCGELSNRIAFYEAGQNGLFVRGEIAVPGAVGLRDLAFGKDHLYAVDDATSRLHVLELKQDEHRLQARVVATLTVGAGAIRVERLDELLLVTCVLDHEVWIHRLDQGVPDPDRARVIRHDGPIWSLSAVREGKDTLVALGGVENRPLDRSGGFFGYIDSFVYLYRISGAAPPEPLAAINVSAYGVVTPKAVYLHRDPDDAPRLLATGYGGDSMAWITWPDGFASTADVQTDRLPPGTTDFFPVDDRGLIAANPLLDAWITAGEHGYFVFHSEPTGEENPDRGSRSRLGEALFFTGLMGPANSSKDAASRFSCETCHFEGHGDGRVHYTGRRDIHATTRPLLGLFNNKPYFSRALDPDMTRMINNEFRVASAHSGLDPWFPIYTADHPWLREFGLDEPRIPPQELRRALMEFLLDFTHPPNPFAAGREKWTATERRGAEVFRDRCESCHRARLVADDPATAVPFEQWESLVCSQQGPIVWGSAEYRQTGIRPYVHEEGTRTPSLRRVYRKVPYFTNGSARTLHEVLGRVQSGAGHFRHGTEPGDMPLPPLPPADQDALEAFLLLL